MRTILIAACTAIWTLSLAFGVTVVCTNRLSDWNNPRLDLATAVVFHPAALTAALLLAVGTAWAVRHLDGTAEFTLGLLVGAGAVLATAVLNALVLLLGGVEDWRSLALVVLAAHLPLAVIEGVILGFTVAFLERVKPEMLTRESAEQPPEPEVAAAEPATAETRYVPSPMRPPILPLVVVGFLLCAAPVQAHRLNVDYKVVPKEHKVIVEAWFSRTDSLANAAVQVFHDNQQLLVEGKMNADGVFAFSYAETEPLRVVVSAPGGHREEVEIPANKLDSATASVRAADPTDVKATDGARFADRSERTPIKDVLLGVSVLLSFAGYFVLSDAHAAALRKCAATQRQDKVGRPAFCCAEQYRAYRGLSCFFTFLAIVSWTWPCYLFRVPPFS